MSTLSRRVTVPYSADQMFELVNDVASYPKFLPWCRGARVVPVDDSTVEASLDIGVAGIHKRFATRNSLSRPNHIGIELVAGPFRRLEGGWTFADLESGGSTVELALEYEMTHSPLGMVFAAAFEEIARSQVSAFVRRAEEIYGRA